MGHDKSSSSLEHKDLDFKHWHVTPDFSPVNSCGQGNALN